MATAGALSGGVGQFAQDRALASGLHRIATCAHGRQGSAQLLQLGNLAIDFGQLVIDQRVDTAA